MAECAKGDNIDVACLIGRHHTPDGIEQLHRFHGQFLHGPAHERAGLFQRNHFSHRIGPSLPPRRAMLGTIAPQQRREPRNPTVVVSLGIIITIAG